MLHDVVLYAGGAVSVAALYGLLRRRVLRPIREATDRLHDWLEQTRRLDEHRDQLRELAGAVTNLAVALLDDRNADRERLSYALELVVEMNADVLRLQGDVARLDLRLDDLAGTG